ncbi:MAG: Calx-beta domain-containing protein [Chitinophagales bacterium]
MKKIFTLIYIAIVSFSAIAQLSLSSAGSAETIDFTGFDGTGFSASPSGGQLNSNTWAALGFSDGDVGFGGEGITGDFARGSTSGLVTTGGVYAVDISGNQGLMVQPTADDFTPGSFTLRMINNTGITIGQLDVSYSIYVLNDQGRANSYNLTYSTDDVTYTSVPEADYTSPEAADFTPYLETITTSITGFSVADGEYLYLRWTGEDVSGSGSRDEFALDDISITPQAGTSSPTYNFSPTSLTVVETSGVAYYDVTLSESADCVFSIGYTEVTADLPTDFGFTSFTVTFTEGGASTQTIDVGIVDDFEVEPTESFIIYYTVTSGECVAGPDDQIEIFIESDDVTGTGVVDITDEITADEGVGTVTGEVTMSETADCEVQLYLDAASTMEEGSDYTFSLPTIITFTDGGTTTQTFDIAIIDDTEIETTEDLIINISILSGSCVTGLSGDLDLFITDNDEEPVIYTPVNIADIHGEDDDGVCTNLGDLVSITGVVYGINLWDGGLQFTLIDNTGGISVFSFAETFGYTVTEGDEVTVNGEIDQFNGLTEIIPDTIIFISEDNGLIDAPIISSLGESTESMLWIIASVDLVDPSQWLGDGSSFNVEFTDGSETFIVRIDNNTELSTFSLDPSAFDFVIEGIGTQFDTESPYTDGYQLMPRYISDLSYQTVGIIQQDRITLKLYPNPTLEKINIISEDLVESLKIINQLGEIVKVVSINALQKTIDVKEFPAGFYAVKIKTVSGVYSSSFIKE